MKNYLLINLTKTPGILVIIDNEYYLSLSSTNNDCFIQILRNKLYVWRNKRGVSLFNVQDTLLSNFSDAFLTFAGCEDHSDHK